MGRAREKLQRLLAPRPEDAPDVVPREVTLAAPVGRAVAPPVVASAAEPAGSRSDAPSRAARASQPVRSKSDPPSVVSDEHPRSAISPTRTHTDVAGARPPSAPASSASVGAGSRRRPPPPAHQMPPASAPLPARVTIGAATGAVRRGEFDAWRRARRAEVYLEAVPADPDSESAVGEGRGGADSRDEGSAGFSASDARPPAAPHDDADVGDAARAEDGRSSAEELSLQRGLGAPRSAADHAVRAGIAAAAGRGGEATAYYERALALGLVGRAWWSAARHLAELYLEADRVDDALPVLEQLVCEPSADPYPLLALASLVEVESPSRAQTLRAQARRIAPWLATE